MRLVDLYYQAFKAFRKHTQSDSNSQKLRSFIAHASEQNDFLTAIKFDCDIELEWIENIEEGLIYVEKAIREDRQFIRTEGEVIQIEKVKKVSKSSVEHLSRHSNLISRMPEDGDITKIIPDKLYVVEKLSDYLVYENRFLYMMLSYLKDFIQIRIDKIKDKTTTYQSFMTMDKDIKASQRMIKYQLSYQELSNNDPVLMDNYELIPGVSRLENVYAITMSLLATPLMKEVSKAPMIKPPVVKTNVLRMNQNFRAALKLYDYISAYNKDGFSFREVKETFNPFPNDMADQMADAIELSSSIAYISSNRLEDKLNDHYLLVEKAKLEVENKKVIEEIKRLKKRIIEMNEDPYEYIKTLEKRNLYLEKENMNLEVEKAKNDALEKEKSNLLNEIRLKEKQADSLNEMIDKINQKVDHINHKYYKDLKDAETMHVAELKEKDQFLKNKMLELDELKEEKLLALVESHKLEVSKLDETISGLNLSIETHLANIQKGENTLKEKEQSYQGSLAELQVIISRLEDEKKYINAQFLAFRAQHNLLSDEDDFTSKEKFKQLELEMIAYKKLFKETWKETKQKIKNQVKEQDKEASKRTNKP